MAELYQVSVIFSGAGDASCVMAKCLLASVLFYCTYPTPRLQFRVGYRGLPQRYTHTGPAAALVTG